MGNFSLAKNIYRGIINKLKTLGKSKDRTVNLNWLTTKYYKHLPPDKIRSHRLFGKALYFYSPTELLHGLEEIFIQEIYKISLPPNPYIIDCGANIGLSLIYMKHHFPGAEILAFEPDETNFNLLQKNMESFGFRDLTLCKEAVWKENMILHFANEGSMSSRIESNLSNNTKAVQGRRLKDFINRTIDFLKIDIEGAEYEVLKDISDNLGLVRNMFLEYHGKFTQNNELTELFDLIQKAGFSYYIKEAACVYTHPLFRKKDTTIPYDLQLNIFCFRE